MSAEDDEELELDGRIPVLHGENGKKLRMGLDSGLPQFYLVTPSVKAEWFMRIHPDKIPNGMQAGDYEGSYGSTPRILTLFPKSDGTTKVLIHPPESTSGRSIFVRINLLTRAWEFTLREFESLRR